MQGEPLAMYEPPPQLAAQNGASGDIKKTPIEEYSAAIISGF